MHGTIPVLPCQVKCLPKVNQSRETVEYSLIQKQAHNFNLKSFLGFSHPVERGTKNIPV